MPVTLADLTVDVPEDLQGQRISRGLKFSVWQDQRPFGTLMNGANDLVRLCGERGIDELILKGDVLFTHDKPGHPLAPMLAEFKAADWSCAVTREFHGTATAQMRLTDIVAGLRYDMGIEGDRKSCVRWIKNSLAVELRAIFEDY